MECGMWNVEFGISDVEIRDSRFGIPALRGLCSSIISFQGDCDFSMISRGLFAEKYRSRRANMTSTLFSTSLSARCLPCSGMPSFPATISRL